VNSENFILKFSVVGGNIAKKSLWEYFFAAICSKTQEEFLPAQGSNAQHIVNGLKLCTKKIVHTLITV